MKFEIQLNELNRPVSKRQAAIMKSLLDEASRLNRNHMVSDMVDTLTIYNKYIDSFKGQYKRKVSYLPSLKENGTDRLANKSPNKYLKAMEKFFNVDNNHSPTQHDKGLWIGVEIECFIPHNIDDESMFDEEGDPIDYDVSNDQVLKSKIKDMIMSRRIKYVTMKHDGSIRPDEGYVAIEFTVLTKINDLSNLEKLCKLLQDLGAKVNKSCGLHIHLDQRDVFTSRNMSTENKKELSARLMRLNQALPLLISLVPKSRRNNSYCKTTRSRMKNSERYKAINTQALNRYSTFEIRLHSATTEFKKISNWIKLCFEISRCTKIVNRKTKMISTIDDLKNKYLTDMSLELYTYLTERYNQFNVQSELTQEVAESSDYITDNNQQTTMIPTFEIPF